MAMATFRTVPMVWANSDCSLSTHINERRQSEKYNSQENHDIQVYVSIHTY